MRKLALFAAGFSAGIFAAQYFLPDGFWLPGAWACLGLGLLALLLPGLWRRRLVLLCVGLSAALGYQWLYVRQVQAPMLALADTSAPATMTLCGYPSQTDYGAKVAVTLEGYRGKAVYYGDAEILELCPGQTVTDTVYFQNAAKIRDDDVTTFTSKGIFLLASSRGEALFGAGTQSAPRWWPLRLGQAIREQIQTLFSGDTAGFLTAILTGERTGLSVVGIADLEEAGLYHVLAVSGMHCGFLLMLVTLLTGRHRRRLLAMIAIPLLVFYALLTGASPSVVRACVMLSFLLAAPLFGRDSDGPTALTAALLFILLQNPFAAASVSLQLSFAAVAGLLWLMPKLYRLLAGEKKHGKLFYFTAASFSATMGALVFTVPISAYDFGFLVLISPLSNLLCLWAASVAFLSGLVTVLVSFLFLPLGMLLAFVPQFFSGYILAAAHLLSRIPYHAVYFTNPYLKYWLAFAYLLFFTAWRLRRGSGRLYLLASVLAALTLCLSVYAGTVRLPGALNLILLDVGQGQSAVLASGDSYALVDCGSANSWYDPGGLAADQLMSLGCGALDALVVTHYDSDHTNGVAKLLARLPVETLFLPRQGDEGGIQKELLALAEDYGVCGCFVEERTEVPLGSARITLFPPVGDTGDNERGIVLLASEGERDLLIPGDLNAAGERALLKTWPLPDIEVLVAGHHGSKYSNSRDLLDALEPETVLISVGSNRYGHPAQETLRRLARAGVEIGRTDLQGTLTISMN